MTNATDELKYYFVSLHRCTDTISCPNCNEYVLPKDFEKHVFEQHGINGKTTCVWCQKVSWPSGKKYKHKKHLLDCSKKHICHEIEESDDPLDDSLNSLDQPPDCPMEDFIQFDHPQDTTPDPLENVDIQPHRLLRMTHEFPEKHFFGHRMTHPDPMIQTLEEFLNTPVSPLPTERLPSLPVAFADANLNLAASCVLLYLKTRKTHDWIHVMVRLPVAESFREALEQDSGQSHTLSFSCWCDGGTYEEAEYRQHRHLIVVSYPKKHFEDEVWPKVKLPRGTRSPKPNYPCKRLKMIKSPGHLANAIGYMSNRKSRCNFSFKDNISARNNHFYLYRTLPIDYKLHLYLLWPGGVEELLKQTKFENVSVARLATGILTRNRKRQWTQKVKDFYDLERGMVARVAMDYVPSRDNRTTPHFLHLTKKRRLYFDRSPENLEPLVWCQKQIEGGNLFYDAVEESTWIPRPRDQMVLNICKPIIDRKRKLEARIRTLESQNRGKNKRIKTLESQVEEMHTRMQRVRDKYKNEEREKNKRIKTLESQLEASKEEMHIRIQQLTDQNKTLESQVEASKEEMRIRVQQLTDQNKTLESQVEKLQASKEEMRIKIQQLTDQVMRYKDEEINRLRLENDRLRLENDRLRRILTQNNIPFE